MRQATAHLFIKRWHLIFTAHICTYYGNTLCKFHKNPSTQQQCTKFLFTKEKKKQKDNNNFKFTTLMHYRILTQVVSLKPQSKITYMCRATTSLKVRLVQRLSGRTIGGSPAQWWVTRFQNFFLHNVQQGHCNVCVKFHCWQKVCELVCA